MNTLRPSRRIIYSMVFQKGAKRFVRMAVVKGKEELPTNVKDVFTNNEYCHEAKLQALQKIKDICKPPDKIFSRVRLGSILQSARTALETKLQDKDFFFNYGLALAGFFGWDATLHSELLYQIEYIMAELKTLDQCRAEALGAMLWNRLESNSIVHSGAALNASEQVIEKMVLDWVNTPGDPHLEFPARMAAMSQQLFQNATAVLYEVLVRSRGHGKVLEVTRLFISKVMSFCEKEGKDFLGLYPKDCRCMVSLLIVEPGVFTDDGMDTVNHVNRLLSEMFLREKYKALILLSQYPAWVRPFRLYLNEIGVL